MSSTNIKSDQEENIPLDARLLSDAIIELNISRRNVAIFPKDHPSVEISLTKAFNLLQKLFEIRAEITLAVAKDTLIIDDYFLDKKNPVYKEFALLLSSFNITYVSFIVNITKEELYNFHRLISEDITDYSPDLLQEKMKECGFIHIKLGFIDYDAFSFKEGKTNKETTDTPLWEHYIYGLLEGTLITEDISDDFNEVSPEMLARLINKSNTTNLKEETYDKVITTYMRRSSDAAFSSADIKRIMEFINQLKPELKKQFLSSTVKTISRDMDAAQKALKDISVEEVIELLRVINEQQVSIPGNLKNLLDKISDLSCDISNVFTPEGSMLLDDISLTTDIATLFEEGNFHTFINSGYQKDIKKLIDLDTPKIIAPGLKEFREQYNDDFIETDLNQVLLELISSETVSEDEYKLFIESIRDHIEIFLWTAQYGQIHRIFKSLKLNIEENRFPEITGELLIEYHSSDFIRKLVDSFKTLGRQRRDETWLLCEYYSDGIIPLLIDALIEEESQMVRSFLISLLKQFGNHIVPNVLNKLGDSRWFVKRNMLYLLGELYNPDVIPHVKLYCHHENPKVSFEAIKCLVKLNDQYGIAEIRKCLYSKSSEIVEQALTLIGAFRIKELVPDLVQLLRKKGFSGEDLYKKIPVVKALGEISDIKALEPLSEILSEKRFLFKGTSEQLKEEIYKTLKKYPIEHIKHLIEIGLKSKNKNIQRESLKLQKERMV